MMQSIDYYGATFWEAWSLSRVGQPELALLPAAVIADQRVIGLLNVDIIAHAEHVASSLGAQ